MKINTKNDWSKQVPALRENETYTVTDLPLLDNLTVSQTILKPFRQTNGHCHEGKEEVYIFTKGSGRIKIQEEYFNAEEGSMFTIPGGYFHQVINDCEDTLEFVAIFQKYCNR